MALYSDRAELFSEFPEHTEEHLQQVLAYALAQLPDRVSDLAGVP